MRNIYFAAFLLLSCLSHGQLVINELDSDNPSTDDKEFIELKSDTPNFPLDGYVIVLYNGSSTSSTASLSYYAIDLDGYTTDVNGLILIGNNNVSPVPDEYFPVSIFQNGPDGVAVYIGNSTDFPDETLATSDNLVDALVYGTSDPEAVELMALLGVSVQVDENINSLGTTQSIQRKSDGTYEVKQPTPGAHNDGSGIPFNGLSVSTSAAELTEGAQVTITFTTQNPVSQNLNFTFTLNSGSFTTSDFSGNVNVFIPAGTSTFSTTITITDDVLDDGDELAIVRFGSLPAGYNRLNDNLEIRVIDNDYTVAAWGTPLNPTYDVVASTAPANYYASLSGKAGAELVQAIKDIIADPAVVREQNYGDVTTILEEADQNPANSNEVWLMYVEEGRAKYKFQTTASNVGSWNREHIFPQSRGGFANGTESTPDGINVYLPTDADDLLAGHGDAHHIRAEDGPENSLRSNRDFGSDYNGPAGTQGSWKGDVARSLFYMAIRYNALSVVNGNPPDTTLHELGDLQSLLMWNQADPSDDFEMNRNNVIYEWQINRNPFIDYPELADYIWGAQAGEAWFPTLGASDYEVSKVNILPNPARDQVTILGLMEVGEMVIYNIAGVEISRTIVMDNQLINISLPSGLYLAKITSGGKTSVRKLLIY